MRAALILGLVALLSSCSLQAPRPQVAEAPPPQVAEAPPPISVAPPAHAEQGAAIAARAAALIGKPYEFGGADLSGFDCSGLALFVYERSGISIPRTAARQQRAAQAVPLTRLLPGDLVFFRMGSGGVDHVGVYIGGGRFVHAPHKGVAVSSADLTEAFYARHLVNGGRFWGGALSAP